MADHGVHGCWVISRATGMGAPERWPRRSPVVRMAGELAGRQEYWNIVGHRGELAGTFFNISYNSYVLPGHDGGGV